jgi:hypothetical protein
MGDIIIPE